ncbi:MULTISPECIES: hypothetical protein [Bacillaceae]|uniref:Uncharacterized protein n=1 Tax=Metabacillus sediminis TaxID=3117746 RepID=A0ABZ2NF15_9BACI|nr:hypothetical protein [Bacillus sp. SJS]
MYLLGLHSDKKGKSAAGMASVVYINYLKSDNSPALFNDLAESSYYNRITHFPLYR